MGWRDSDAVAQTMEGDDGSGSGVASGWDGGIVNALARLGRRSPYAGMVAAKKIKPSSKAPTPSDPDLISSIGAADAGSGPNGSNPAPIKVRKDSDPSPDTLTSGMSATPYGPPEVGSTAPDASVIAPAPVPRDIASGPTDLPTLAPQGGSNRFVRALARLSGLAGPTPDPGQPYVGPGTGFTVDSDSGQIRKQTYAERRAQPSPLSLLGRALQQVGASMGTPQQKLWALEQPQQEQEMNLRLQMAQNEANYRRGMLGYHDRANDIAAKRACAARLRLSPGLCARCSTCRVRIATFQARSLPTPRRQQAFRSRQQYRCPSFPSGRAELQSYLLGRMRSKPFQSH